MVPVLLLEVPGWIGSPTDVATFVALLYLYRQQLVPRLDVASAAVVACAETVRSVDHEHLQEELDVDDAEIDAVRPTIVCGGNSSGSGSTE